jgi:hypothetical protein
MLASQLVMMLSHPQLEVDLPSMCPCFLLLLVGLLLNGEELHPQLRCRSPHRNRRGGLECQGVLRRRWW